MKESICEKHADWLYIYPTDNTYVENKEKSDKNFSTAEHMRCILDNNRFSRLLIKFNITKAYGENVKEGFLGFYTHQGDTEGIYNIYEADCNFNEETVTMDNCPAKRNFIKSFSTNSCADVIDFTDYIKKCIENGKKEISIAIECDKNSAVYKDFSTSRKSVKSKRFRLMLLCGNETYERNLPFENRFGDKDIFKYADKLVDEYLEHYKLWGESNDKNIIAPIKSFKEEYSHFTKAKKSAGSETFFTFPVRHMEDLKGYKKTVDNVDDFGGDISRTYESTGYFYIKEINGRWMLIDPLGHPYFNSGICTLVPGNTEYQKKCIIDRYGSFDNWGKEISKRFKKLRIGSTGGSSAIEYISKSSDPINMMMTLGFASGYARQFKMTMSGSGCVIFINNNCLPVFDPEFVTFSDKKAMESSKDWKENPYFIGYMSDNEISVEKKTLYNYLTLDTDKAENSYAYAFAWRWLAKMTGKENPSFSDITDELIEKFRGAVYDRYFYVVSSSIKKHDPNHLYMGCRFKNPGYLSEQIMRAEGYYCDICTHNLYFCWEADSKLLSNWANWNKKPFIVTEFYTKAMDTGFSNKAGAGWICENQQGRADFFENYVLKLLESTNCVGFHWFRYMDCDSISPGANISDIDVNKGIVKSDSTEYTELTDRMYKVCSNIYSLIEFFNKRRKSGID